MARSAATLVRKRRLIRPCYSYTRALRNCRIKKQIKRFWREPIRNGACPSATSFLSPCGPENFA
eukprot:4162975-Prymnesium_polylepis.1